MSSNGIDFRSRAQLTEFMDEPCSRDELRPCLRDIARLNRWFLAYRPTLDWLNTIVSTPPASPLSILDVGCGYGDTLRRIARWARSHCIAVELTGLDINPDTIAIAAEATPAAIPIRWIAADIFVYHPEESFQIVISSIFAHHLGEPEIVRFLQWMERYTTLGWFVNDLSRAPIPYHLLRVFSKFAHLHPFVQHDGPVSIARAFVPQDWQRMCASAGINGSASIQPYKPARLCVARRKLQ